MSNSHQKSWKLDNLLPVLVLCSEAESAQLNFLWIYSQLPVALTHRCIIVLHSCLFYLAKLNRKQRCKDVLSPDTLGLIMGKSK